MDALQTLKEKRSRTDLERAVLYVSDPQKYDIDYIDIDHAAAQLAAYEAAITAVKKLAETAETHRVEYNRRYGEMEKPVYWDGRRDEAGWFRDQLAAALAALDALSAGQKGMTR